MRARISMLMAAGVLLAASAVAEARPAVVTNDLHVRSGPGTRYPVIGVLPAGIGVDAGDCVGTWCQVANGYASARYLAAAQGTQVVVRRGVPYVSPAEKAWGPTGPVGSWGWSWGWGGPYWSEPGYFGSTRYWGPRPGYWGKPAGGQ